MGQLESELALTLEHWRRGRASLVQTRNLARELGQEHFSAGISALVELLDHEDEIVRYNAAMSLAFDLKHKPATDKLLTMLVADADEDVRDVAAGSLGILWENTKNGRVLQLLAKTALNDHDKDLQKSAYKALLIVYGIPREEMLTLLTGVRLPVDRDRVESVLREISSAGQND